MSLWLQNNNKYNLKSFFIKIFLISVIVHLIILGALFFGFKDKALNLDIFLNRNLIKNSPVPIVFLPFTKTVPGSLKQLKNLNKSKTKAVKSKNKKDKPIIKKAVIKKPIIVEKVNKKKIADASKLKNKKVDKVKEVKPIEKIKPPEPKAEVEKPKEPEKIKEEPIVNEIESMQEVIDLNQSVAIYLGTEDMQGLTLANNIQGEIIKNWKPPVGLPKNIKCTFNIKVDNNGKVTDFKIEKSSNVLSYDISLRNAILKAVMPNEIKGKEFTLTLNG